MLQEEVAITRAENRVLVGQLERAREGLQQAGPRRAADGTLDGEGQARCGWQKQRACMHGARCACSPQLHDFLVLHIQAC